jgi:hypothetical protein
LNLKKKRIFVVLFVGGILRREKRKVKWVGERSEKQ